MFEIAEDKLILKSGAVEWYAVHYKDQQA